MRSLFEFMGSDPINLLFRFCLEKFNGVRPHYEILKIRARKGTPEQLVSLVETSLKIEYNTCSLWAVPMTRLIVLDPLEGYGESDGDQR